MRRAAILTAALLALAAPVAARVTVARIDVSDAVIRPAAAGQPMTGAYMTLANPTARPVRLTAVSCACAGMVSAHESRMVGGVMQMRPAGAVVVPAHGSVNFKPGGLHLMVMDLKRPIAVGDRVTMRLGFDNGLAVTVPFKAER